MGDSNPTDELRAKLDELGVKYTIAKDAGGTQHVWWSDGEKEVCAIDSGRMSDELAVYHLTPEQAIAATVGNRTDLAKRLREVTGLHSFAELFGFSWEDDSDWTWHDVACAMADAVDAATVGAGTCTMKPDGYLDEQYGIYECSNCGESWQFPYDGPKENGWKFCPHCRAEIEEETE